MKKQLHIWISEELKKEIELWSKNNDVSISKITRDLWKKKLESEQEND